MPPSTAASSKELTPSDAAYLVECLRHGSSSVVVNVPAIAVAMNTKPHNVTCRISGFRKKYGLNIACTSAATGAGPAPPAGAKTRPAAAATVGKNKRKTTDAGSGDGDCRGGTGNKKPKAVPLEAGEEEQDEGVGMVAGSQAEDEGEVGGGIEDAGEREN